MSQNGFILRSVLYGLFLGLAIVTGWLFSPHILALFHPSATEVADQLTAIEDKGKVVKIIVPNETNETSPTGSPDKNEEKNHLFDNAMPAVDFGGPAWTEQGAKEEKILYPFWKFDERTTAQNFLVNIEKQSGVELVLGQEGYRYVVYIPAANKEKKSEKAGLIKRETGIVELEGTKL